MTWRAELIAPLMLLLSITAVTPALAINLATLIRDVEQQYHGSSSHALTTMQVRVITSYSIHYTKLYEAKAVPVLVFSPVKSPKNHLMKAWMP